MKKEKELHKGVKSCRVSKNIQIFACPKVSHRRNTSPTLPGKQSLSILIAFLAQKISLSK